jgi:preprotein translocase subunit SecG
MENILLILNVIISIILVSQDNFMLSRSAGDFMSKATAIVATLFIICSLSLTIISREDLKSNISVIDKIEDNTDDTPKIPEN